MSEEISPQSEKMDISETSDQSNECEVNQVVNNVAISNREHLDNDHCSKTQSPTITTTKNMSKCIVTNSHPLMYSPDSESPYNKNFVNESRIDNFNPGAHSSALNLVSKSVESNLEGSLDLDLDLPNIESYSVELPEFPESPSAMKKSLMYDMPIEVQGGGTDQSDTENDRSIYEAVLSPNLQNVSLTMNEKHGNLNFLAQVTKSNKLRKIKVVPTSHSQDSDVSSVDSVSDSIKSDEVYQGNNHHHHHTNVDLDMNFIKELLDSPDDIDDSVLDPPDFLPAKDGSESPANAEPIKEYSAEEERRESRHWLKIVLPSGEHRNIDMRVIEPYKRVLSHGGYLKAGGHNAIIVFSACYLPDKSRKDYVYVMDNLFLYVLQTLDQLVTEDYVLVYLHGSASSHCIPTIGWLKRCYQLIDRRLRKNLKQLYLVHPTFWLKTIIMMTKPFISAKFYRKLHFINSLQELTNCLPVEQAAIPERVINYDKLKFST